MSNLPIYMLVDFTPLAIEGRPSGLRREVMEAHPLLSV
jgi:hypothetical protein